MKTLRDADDRRILSQSTLWSLQRGIIMFAGAPGVTDPARRTHARATETAVPGGPSRVRRTSLARSRRDRRSIEEAREARVLRSVIFAGHDRTSRRDGSPGCGREAR